MLYNKLKIIFLLFLLSSCADDNINNSNTDELSEDELIFGASNNLNIVTWNVEHFPKSDLTIQYLKQAILSMKVDILVLQEIENSIYFNQLVDELGGSWVGYRYENSDWGELSYLINSTNITFESPYSILNEYQYDFAYRPPYVLEFEYQNQEFILINVHYKCCGGEDNEDRRLNSSLHLHDYISNNFTNENVIVMGDFNDELIDDNNVFEVFFNNFDQYLFADYSMAEESNPWEYWSFPTYPSHIDHVLISNELFDEYQLATSICNTILIDDFLFNSWTNYDEYVSDHRPVGFSLSLN